MNEAEEQTEERMEGCDLGSSHFPVVGVTGLEQLTSEQKLENLQNFWQQTKVQYYQQLCEIDREDDTENPQLVSEYAEECSQHMIHTEKENVAKIGYMTTQDDINEKMRAILVDWLIEVHHKFKLLPETLFLTINLIDRYLEKQVIHRTKLQLVGVTAMLIASKYEEIYAPEVRDFVYITDKAYDKQEILKQEYELLSQLDFNVCTPSSFRFLERFAKVAGLEQKQFNLARYLIELPLIEYRMLKYNPSLLSSAALFLALKIIPKHRETEDFDANGEAIRVRLPAWDEKMQ
jgi:G2/mitotic-specific cyclin-B, other